MAAPRRKKLTVGKLSAEEWAERYWQKHAEVQEVRQENRRIQRALDAVLMLRSQIRDEVAEEIEALSDKLEEYQEGLRCAEEAVEDRPLMLRALGWDEFEWERRKWAL